MREHDRPAKNVKQSHPNRQRWGTVRELLELGKGSASKKLALVLLLGVLFLQAVLIWSYVGALHSPSPLNVPIGITGPPPIVDALTAIIQRSGNEFSAKRFDSTAAAQSALEQRKIPAYLVTAFKSDTLVVSEATSSLLAAQLPAQIKALEPPNRTLTVKKQFMLPKNDPRGLASFYIVVGWVVGGYLAATILGLALGDRTKSYKAGLERIGVLGIYALAAGATGAVIAQSLIGVLQGNFFYLFLAGSLIAFTVAMMTSALQSTLGILGTSLAILLLVALGNPGSGGPILNELLMPGPWRTLGRYLPPYSGTDLVKSINYFETVGISRDVTVLAAYTAVGAIVTVVNINKQKRPAPKPKIHSL